MKKSSTWMMLAPGLIILLLCLGLPLISVLTPTFTAGQYPLSAYVEFFQDEYYRKILFRTLKIAVITTGICMAGGIPTAYFISRCDKKWRGLLLAASIFPMMTNSVIRSFAWINILGSNGIINRILLALNVADKPMKLLYTDFAIIIGSVYLFLPLMIVTVTGVMENIDDDMMEAAQSLGAGRFEARVLRAYDYLLSVLKSFCCLIEIIIGLGKVTLLPNGLITKPTTPECGSITI